MSTADPSPTAASSSSGGSTTAERLRARKGAAGAKGSGTGKPGVLADVGPVRYGVITLRGWMDALVLAYLLAVFIRMFTFELFMIPTGSMTPTLIGDADRRAAFADYNGDGIEDVFYQTMSPSQLLVYIQTPSGVPGDVLYVENLPIGFTAQLFEESAARGAGLLATPKVGRTDFILVNKFAYWFSAPKRGEISIFKTPDRPEAGFPFDPTKPIYIKRVVGEAGEAVRLEPITERTAGYGDPSFIGTIAGLGYGVRERHIIGSALLVDGKGLPAEDIISRIPHFPRPTYGPRTTDGPQTIVTADDEVTMLGDNQASSADSRYWGGVPLENMRGKAVLRYWPVREFRFY